MTQSSASNNAGVAPRAVWFAVAAIGLLLLGLAAVELYTGFGPNWPATIVGLCFLSLRVIAKYCHWGSIVPGMLLGAFMASITTPALASSHEEAVFHDLGRPLIGAVIGAIFGAILDMFRTSKPRADLRSEGCGSSPPPAPPTGSAS